MAGLHGLRAYVQWLLALQRGEERIDLGMFGCSRLLVRR